ncbi:TldD protein [Escherichia coli]|uniref:TldD protein n=1 Tax=Escherichia coli TaxID=562 RepID=A0A2X1MVE9_ECOLX|nr:TldD protein [Escherichia coli]
MSLNLVSEQLLAANGLKHQDLFAILGQLAERRLDYGDLYFQSSYYESWVLEDRIIKDGSYNIDQGVGVRAISGEKTGFAYADQISLLALEQSAQAARTIVRDSGDGKVQTLGAVEHSPLYTSVDPLQSMSREEKLDILRRVDKVAREADKRVQEVTASLSGVYELILGCGHRRHASGGCPSAGASFRERSRRRRWQTRTRCQWRRRSFWL